ncbi:alanine racemase [Aestuariivirga litoralis]|uniref:alanine racemase n=1 Tax=Aestuariivirga litoralis TaxID=2650924 RepID=UPI0018C75DDB|nr:alanine racemase [Aestuariivirga litoralis]MBG1232400.1 D-TA family PLP-dependent enzyme [Aestuariivirga litoralis]
MGKRLEDLETPVPIIDFDIMLANLVKWQAHCDKLGIASRPHIKTHKLASVARLQIALGAKGICVQKLGEAEVMADAGIRDQLLTFNVLGRAKQERLAKLMNRTDIAVVADSVEVIESLALAAKLGGRKLEVLVECDTGMGRNGVQSPAAAVALAERIENTAGLTFGGLMTYPPAFKRKEVAAFIAEAKQGLSKSGLPCPRVSSGGSKDLWDESGLEEVTEYRVGTNIYNDRTQVAVGAYTFADCAETVLATVVSTPTPERALIDAGSKALTSDLSPLPGYGVVQDLNMIPVYALNEEHGYLDTSTSPRPLKVGEQVRITMNHVCPVNNLFDKVVFVRGNEVLGAVKVDARGKVQ